MNMYISTKKYLSQDLEYFTQKRGTYEYQIYNLK